MNYVVLLTHPYFVYAMNTGWRVLYLQWAIESNNSMLYFILFVCKFVFIPNDALTTLGWKQSLWGPQDVN